MSTSQKKRKQKRNKDIKNDLNAFCKKMGYTNAIKELCVKYYLSERRIIEILKKTDD